MEVNVRCRCARGTSRREIPPRKNNDKKKNQHSAASGPRTPPGRKFTSKLEPRLSLFFKIEGSERGFVELTPSTAVVPQ